MTSRGLEWDSLDCPLVGLPSGCKPPFPTDSEITDLWRCQIHSLWSMSSATGYSTSSRTGGSRRSRLKQEEDDEEGRRQWRRAGKEPGGSGRVKEVSQTCSYWASGNLSSPPSYLPPKQSTPPPPQPLLLLLLLCSAHFLSSLEWPSPPPLLPPLSPPSLLGDILPALSCQTSPAKCPSPLICSVCSDSIHGWAQPFSCNCTFMLSYTYTHHS